MSHSLETLEQRNLRRVDIEGRTVYVLGEEAQEHLEQTKLILIKARLRRALLGGRVRDMREAQKEYFRHRERDVLIRSKELEKLVDACLQEEPA